MKIRTVISSFALVSAMALSGGAAAQSMVGDMAIPEERIVDFQEKCRAIASVQNESLAGGQNLDQTDDIATGAVSSSDSPDYANEDNIDGLLASMTPDQCRDAGLLDGPVPATSNN
jgi:hypothetical protein